MPSIKRQVHHNHLFFIGLSAGICLWPVYFLSTRYVPSVYPGRKLDVSRKTRDDLASGAITAYAMSDKLKANYGFFEILQTDDAIRLVLHYDDAEDIIFKAIELKEKSILDLFADFFMYLPNSDYVLSQAETIAQLDDMIEAVKFRPEV